MKKIVSSLLAVTLLLTIFTPIPLTSAASQIAVFTNKATYFAGDSVYVFGTVAYPAGRSERLRITVTNPSGDDWASILLLPDTLGNFGATVGTISSLDSTGTYVVSVTYRAFTNSTTFEVKTPRFITVETDKLVYLVNEAITVSGRVAPLIEGYRVTLRMGPEDSSTPGEISAIKAVAQATPKSDGSYILKDFFRVRSKDNGRWIVNATYGPSTSANSTIYVGLQMNISSEKAEYLPGQSVTIGGVVSPIVSGPVRVVIKNPAGGVWFADEATPDSEGEFNVTNIVFPGDQVGNYSVSASYWGVSGNTWFLLGRLGSSTMGISDLGVFDPLGVRVFFLRPGSEVRVSATLTNLDIVMHKYVFIIQIKNSSGELVLLGSDEGSVDPGSFRSLTLGGVIDVEDTYTVEVFVWDSWEEANPLSERQTLNFRVA